MLRFVILCQDPRRKSFLVLHAVTLIDDDVLPLGLAELRLGTRNKLERRQHHLTR